VQCRCHSPHIITLSCSPDFPPKSHHGILRHRYLYSRPTPSAANRGQDSIKPAPAPPPGLGDPATSLLPYKIPCKPQYRYEWVRYSSPSPSIPFSPAISRFCDTKLLRKITIFLVRCRAGLLMVLELVIFATFLAYQTKPILD